MVDPAFVYVGGVLVLFFFWMYGIVAFLRDVKNRLVPAYRQWRRDDADRPPGGGGHGPRRADAEEPSDRPRPRSRPDE